MINTLWIIAKRELLEMFTNRRIMLSIGMFLIIWGIIVAPRFLQFSPHAGIPDNGIFYMTTILSVYVVLILSSQAFVNEKRDGRIETLLCTPVDLRTFWLGKVLGVSIAGYIAAVGIAAVLFIVSAAVSSGGAGRAPVSLPLVVYVLGIIPLLLAAFAGLLGFFQLAFGMKENRILNLVVFIIIFGLLGAAGVFVGSGGQFSWRAAGTLLAGALILLVVVFNLSRVLNKEKIVTSIE